MVRTGMLFARAIAVLKQRRAGFLNGLLAFVTIFVAAGNAIATDKHRPPTRTAATHAVGSASKAAPVSTAAHPTVLASAKTATAPPTGDSAVIRALLAGQDARAAVADALSTMNTGPKSAKAAASGRSSAFGAYANGIHRVSQTLKSAREAWSKSTAMAARPPLADALANLLAQRLLVDARVEQIDLLVAAPSMPAVARQRWAAHRMRITASVSELDAAAQRLLDVVGHATDNTIALPIDELDALITNESRSSAAPIYGAATLPMFRPRLATRDPAMSPVIIPSYANSVDDDAPVAADYASSMDTPLSGVILDQAQTLGRDYTRIFDFVRSQVRTQWYAGAQKGAEATLRTHAGNDVDQAALLISLLRASGAPARFVRGVLDVPVADLAAMLGVRTDDVGRALSAAGVPNRPLVSAGRISGFAIEQVYVSAYVPFSNYRGTSADLDGRAWIPLAPSIKSHAFVPAAGALARVGLSVADFTAQYLSAPQTLAPLELLRPQVSDGLTHVSPPLAYESQLSQIAVDAPAIELLPSSLPVRVESVIGEFAQLPDTLRQHARIVVRSGASETDPVVFDHVFSMAQLLDRRVTLSYQPASIDDGRIADQHGGLGGTPPYLIHLRAVVNIAGLPVTAGSGEIEGGASHRIEITLDSPAGTAFASQQVTAGGITALVFDAQGDPPPQQADDSVLVGESETKAARLLANFGARYLETWDRADDELARLVGVSVMRPFPSLALVINQYSVNRIDGVADALIWSGVGLDAALRPVEPIAQSDNPTAPSDWLTLASLQGSVLEHQVFEQQWLVNSISADKGLAIALQNGTPILTLTQATGTAGVNQPQPVLDAISAWIARGYVVEVPRDPVHYESWVGAIWRVRSSSTGEAGYFIAGGLAGGSTAMPPELWYFQDLAEWLANPYGQDASDDPLSGVVLSLDGSAQWQDGVADTALTKPLHAFVQDASGRPVRGAQVQFRVTTGTGKLIGPGGDQVAQAVFTTDRFGTATAGFVFGKQQGTFGSYRTQQGQPYPQWVGHNLIEVSATATVGTLYSGQPYLEFTLPDVPSKLSLLGDDHRFLTPGMAYLPYRAQVTDRYDNEVSNVPVALSATTQYIASSCATSTHVDTIDATLFAPGQCLPEIPQLTGNACALPNLAISSKPGGAPFFVVPPKTALAKVSVAGNAQGAAATLHLSTNDELFDGCSYAETFRVLEWAHTITYGYTPLTSLAQQLLDAARPGEVMPAPQRVDAYRAEIAGGDHADVIWHPGLNAHFTSHLQNGNIENVRELGGGGYLVDMRAGPDPGPVHGTIDLDWNGIQARMPGVADATRSQDPEDIIYAWSVDPRAPEVTPSPIPLTPFGATDQPIHIQVKTLPGDYYAAPVQIELLQGNDVLATSAMPIGDGDHSYADFARGMRVDTSKAYSARVVLNDGTPFRLESPSTPLVFGQGIIAGYDLLPPATQPIQATQSPKDSSDPVGDILRLQGHYAKKITISEDVDVPSGYSCALGDRFGYLLAQDATVTIKFYKLGVGGAPSPLVAWAPLDGVAQTTGVHDLMVTIADLPVGSYQFKLDAVASDGKSEHYVGSAHHGVRRNDSLPLAHSFVKGVDLFSGNAIVSEEDIAIGGRGPGLKLSRTYVSHQGDQRGFYGRGWSSDLDSRVTTDACNTRVVIGAAGQGQRYRQGSIDADGTAHFIAINGYHGTLTQHSGEYDFYAKDGTRYHYAQPDSGGPRLSYVEDTNGNRVGYSYELTQGPPHVNRIEDSAGRHIDITYAVKHVTRHEAGVSIEDSFAVATDARGPGGLKVHYDYDDQENLLKVTRSEGESQGPGTRMRGYTYQDFGGVYGSDANGEPTYFQFGYRLMSSTNPVDNATREYTYELGLTGFVAENGSDVLVPEQRVKTITEPDHRTTTFAYVGIPGLSPAKTDVADARVNSTHYEFNQSGAAEIVTDPVGTTKTSWDTAALQPATVEDALHTLTTYAYDAAGNKTSEVIQPQTGSPITRRWTYKPEADFTSPFIRDRMATATDGNGHDTTYNYDGHGNRTLTTRGGISDKDGYDPQNGDHGSHTDGLNHTWLWRYDTYGTVREAEDPLHHTTATTYDERGRKLNETDANSHRTKYTWDAQDRLLTTTYPPTEAGSAVQTSAYDDAADKRTDTNPNQHVTVSSFDAMGRLLGVSRDDGSARSMEYDENGNLTKESDFGSPSTNFTAHVYDAANRRTQTHEPEGRTTIYTHDALGHVLSETVGDGADARTTEYEYRHALYKRTLVRRAYREANSSAVETIGYDGNRNPVSSTDALSRTTTRKFDARDRQYEEDAPLGRITKTAFDDADRVTTQTLVNPGLPDQVRTREYDVAGRLTATVDATGGRRSFSYDAANNVTSRSDARGDLTNTSYDARNHPVSETGPETGQVTTYGYDLAGNRVKETWANGNVRLLGYDHLERHISTADNVGAVESFTYTPNDQVETHTDANGHRTTNHYDGLHRRDRQDLPSEPGQPRAIVDHYDVHGDLLSESDPGQHATTHTYDSLGRLRSTTLPDVANAPTATQTFDDDLVGNRTRQKDARGNETTFVYDDLNRKTQQTDPITPDGQFTQGWTYDAAGNVLRHTDRRGLVTTTTYDLENRPRIVTRDGLTTSTTTYDADGHVETVTDALQNITTTHYDRAGRRIGEDLPLGATRSWTYTPMNDVDTATDEDGRSTTNTYTPRRYVASVTLAGETTTTGYDGEGHVTSIQHPLGDTHAWLYAYDAADRLVSVTDPIGGAVTVPVSAIYAYDADGNRTRQTDANGHITSFTYDERHRHTTTIAPTVTAGTAVASWTYDADGNVATQHTPNGRTLTLTTDALNRTINESVDAPATQEIANTAWHHDGNGNVVGTDETLGDNSVRHATRHYDAFDRPDHEVDVHGKAVDLVYDAVGNRTHLTDADQQTTNWSYDALNHNTSVTVPGQGTTTIDAFPSGRVHILTRPDGSTTTTQYDDAGRIQAIVHAKGGSELAHEAYRYDLDGNRIEQKEANGAVTANVEQTTTYTYDEADRLTDTQTPERTTHYVLDLVGNRTTEQIRTPQSVLIGNSTLTYDARDQLTQRDDAVTGLHLALQYDLDGNTQTQTVGSDTRTFAYDASDRLLSLTLPGQQPLTFDYQSDGLRIAKHQGANETRYQYDQQSLLAETNAIGNTTASYHYSATQLISRTEAGSTPSQRHYLLDALNTPIALLTQEGAISARTKYDAWGEISAQQATSGAVTTPNTDGANAELPNTDLQTVGYTGYVKDQESGLYYAKARYYDPRIARFTTQDPEAGQAMQPPSLHRYLYAYANPTVYTDPTGRVGFLTTLRDAFDQVDQSLRTFATAHPYVAGRIGEVRGASALMGAPVRAVNLASDALAQMLPEGGLFDGVSQQGSAEFGKTVDNVVPLASAYIQDPELTKYRIAENLGSRVLNTGIAAARGDGGAISDISSTATQLAVPLAAEGTLPRLLNTVGEASRATVVVTEGSSGGEAVKVAGVANTRPAPAPIGKSGYASVREFSGTAYAKYQDLVDTGYARAEQAIQSGKLRVPAGVSTKTVLGQFTDDFARTGMQDWLADEGINEGNGALVQINRYLRDPSYPGAYRIPDVNIPGADQIYDATLANKTWATPQVRGFFDYSRGSNITIVKPTQLGGSYSVLPPW